ncbi:Clotting factor B [Zancudomyces culisetae]|uniref:Clotting factor B n=1 Tax=Zancudomyces culisetae TaxID=1213189 RepID=A0A1R1PHI0_ZANCU|nr:Clotting factor B [Zancudomyces culisetae]|eukprot:OMH80434.1 Clotting factor B [Zancudomyces culisetae]
MSLTFKYVVSLLFLFQTPCLSTNLARAVARDFKAVGRIINGETVSIQSFPFIVSISIASASEKRWCTGSLISDSVVVTAGHCLNSNGAAVSPSQVSVSAGSVYNYLMNSNRYNASNVYIHPEYSSKDQLLNDIGLIALVSPVPSTVATPVSIYSGKIPDGVVFSTAGWGVTSLDANATISNVLLQIPLSSSSSSTCKIVNPKWTNNDGATICSIVLNNQDSCSGDSGGPLMLTSNTSTSIAGLTSYGYAPGVSTDVGRCGINGGAGIYTHIYYYMDWITSIVNIYKKTDTTSELGHPDNSTSAESVSTNDSTFSLALGTTTQGQQASTSTEIKSTPNATQTQSQLNAFSEHPSDKIDSLASSDSVYSSAFAPGTRYLYTNLLIHTIIQVFIWIFLV